MKKLIQLGLVITLTIISVFAMTTIKDSDIQKEPVFLKDMEEEYGKPEGTGYLFDDFDKKINIPFEEEDKINSNEEKESSQLETEKYNRIIIKKNMAILEEEKAFSPVYDSKSATSTTYKPKDIRGESKVIISRVKNNISFEDKLSLIKIVSKLSLRDLNEIKNAIINGTTNSESIKLWTMLRNKLPSDEYKKLENIIVKYE